MWDQRLQDFLQELIKHPLFQKYSSHLLRAGLISCAVAAIVAALAVCFVVATAQPPRTAQAEPTTSDELPITKRLASNPYGEFLTNLQEKLEGDGEGDPLSEDNQPLENTAEPAPAPIDSEGASKKEQSSQKAAGTNPSTKAKSSSAPCPPETPVKKYGVCYPHADTTGSPGHKKAAGAIHPAAAKPTSSTRQPATQTPQHEETTKKPSSSRSSEKKSTPHHADTTKPKKESTSKSHYPAIKKQKTSQHTTKPASERTTSEKQPIPHESSTTHDRQSLSSAVHLPQEETTQELQPPKPPNSTLQKKAPPEEATPPPAKVQHPRHHLRHTKRDHSKKANHKHCGDHSRTNKPRLAT